MSNISPFNPNGFLNFVAFSTIAIAATTSSQSATFTNVQAVNAGSVMVANTSTGVIFVAFGTGAATATVATGTESTTSIPVPAGAIMVLTKGKSVDTVAVIASIAGNVYLSCGVGA